MKGPDRQKLIVVHLTIASVLFPMVALVAVSGGLFLAGVQGSYRVEDIDTPHNAFLDVTAPRLELRVGAVLQNAGVEHTFKSLDIERTPAVQEPAAAPEGAPAADDHGAEDAAHDHDDHGSSEPEDSHGENARFVPMTTTLTTQPEYKTHYRITVGPQGEIGIERRSPDLQRRLIGLHRGEAEAPFIFLQYAMAIGLLFVLAIGLYLGLSHWQLRRLTAAAAITGFVLFLVLATVP